MYPNAAGTDPRQHKRGQAVRRIFQDRCTPNGKKPAYLNKYRPDSKTGQFARNATANSCPPDMRQTGSVRIHYQSGRRGQRQRQNRAAVPNQPVSCDSLDCSNVRRHLFWWEKPFIKARQKRLSQGGDHCKLYIRAVPVAEDSRKNQRCQRTFWQSASITARTKLREWVTFCSLFTANRERPQRRQELFRKSGGRSHERAASAPIHHRYEGDYPVYPWRRKPYAVKRRGMSIRFRLNAAISSEDGSFTPATYDSLIWNACMADGQVPSRTTGYSASLWLRRKRNARFIMLEHEGRMAAVLEECGTLFIIMPAS